MAAENKDFGLLRNTPSTPKLPVLRVTFNSSRTTGWGGEGTAAFGVSHRVKTGGGQPAGCFSGARARGPRLERPGRERETERPPSAPAALPNPHVPGPETPIMALRKVARIC